MYGWLGSLTLFTQGCIDVGVLQTVGSHGGSPRPAGVREVEGSLWVPEVNDDAVYVVDPDSGAARSVPGLPGKTHDIAFDGTHLWLSTLWEDPSLLQRFDLDGNLDRTFRLPPELAFPTAFAYDATRDGLWVVNSNGEPSRMWLLDATSGNIVEDWPLPEDIWVPYGLDVSPEGDRLWLAHERHLLEISIADRTVLDATRVAPPNALLVGLDQVAPDEFWLVYGNVLRSRMVRKRVRR